MPCAPFLYIRNWVAHTRAMWYWALAALPALLLLPWRIGVYMAFDLLETRANARVRVGVLPPITLRFDGTKSGRMGKNKPKRSAKGARRLPIIRLVRGMRWHADAHMLLGVGNGFATAMLCGALQQGTVGGVVWHVYPSDAAACKGFVRLHITFTVLGLLLSLLGVHNVR